MADDEELAERVGEVLRRRRGVGEKKMFGGLAFMVNGHMASGVQGDDLMVRVGPDDYEAASGTTHRRFPQFVPGKVLGRGRCWACVDSRAEAG